METDFATLIRGMKEVRTLLDMPPDDYKWTQEQLALLEDVRHEALRLADMVEGILLEEE